MPEALKTYLRRVCDLKSLAFAVALFVIYTACLYHLLPEGINKEFSQKAHEKGAVVLGVLLAVIWLFRKKLPPVSLQEVFDKGHAFLLLLPLTPIMQYTLLNQDILTLPASLAFIAIHAGIAFALILAVPYLLRKRVPLAASTVVATALLYLYFNMSILAAERHWLNEGSFLIQLAVFVALFAGLSILYPFRRQFLYYLIAVFFLTNTGFAMMEMEPLSEGEQAVEEAIVFPYEQELLAKKPLSTPDIYLLVFDSYVGNETMLQYGIDNSAQENFLKEQGFRIYPDTYSMGSGTLSTMSRLLNITDVPKAAQARMTSGDSTVIRLLQANGYKTYSALSAYWFGKYDSNYNQLPGTLTKDELRSSALEYLLQASAEGQFRFDVGDIGHASFPQRVKKKRKVIALESDAPKFLYSHTGPSHSQNSGKCLPDEIERYQNRLDIANKEMREDIRLIDSMGKEAIIIVMGDHGPHLTGNCYFLEQIYSVDEITRLHIQDNLGAFIAIRWPERYKTRSEADNIRIVQDIFPAVFAKLYQDDKVLEYRLPAETKDHVGGAYVKEGIIQGGVNDGEPLFPKGE